MKNNHVYQQTIELLGALVDLMMAIEDAPPRLFPEYLDGKERRLLRRRAERLRSGEARPAHENLFSAAMLARLFDDTVAANELREKTGPEFDRIGNGIGRLMREDGPTVKQAMFDFFLDTAMKAQEDGPGSEAERRHRHLQRFVEFTKTFRDDVRRDKRSRTQKPQPERKALVPLVPAELLTSAPPGEPLIPIPAEDSGRERMLIRIDHGERSWIGHFECGSKRVSSAFMLPDRKHLFVSADGAGYIIDYKTRALVERDGTGIVGTLRDYLLTIFIVIHDSSSFEAFGKEGRLWRTRTIGDGLLRKVLLKDDVIVGEAWHKLLQQWAPFVVSLATGEVSYGSNIVFPLHNVLTPSLSTTNVSSMRTQRSRSGK